MLNSPMSWPISFTPSPIVFAANGLGSAPGPRYHGLLGARTTSQRLSRETTVQCACNSLTPSPSQGTVYSNRRCRLSWKVVVFVAYWQSTWLDPIPFNRCACGTDPIRCRLVSNEFDMHVLALTYVPRRRATNFTSSESCLDKISVKQEGSPLDFSQLANVGIGNIPCTAGSTQPGGRWFTRSMLHASGWDGSMAMADDVGHARS